MYNKKHMEEKIMWKQGAIGVKDENGRMVSVNYWIKHYEEPSEEYGISGGRISKLMLRSLRTAQRQAASLNTPVL